MFEKNLSIGLLLDFYGEILPAHTRALMDMYFNEDLSLAEIAEGEGVSRQAIRQAIKKGEEELIRLEERLLLCAQSLRLEPVARELLALANASDGSSAVLAEKAKECALLILNKSQKEVDDVSGIN